ncbi:hypothetical protein EDC01DRAFT_670257 [Geopyxis carbonaria]|nr:hypothetical protein EDC01DRAFT_670257 [Geopyxis carbonaria]
MALSTHFGIYQVEDLYKQPLCLQVTVSHHLTRTCSTNYFRSFISFNPAKYRNSTTPAPARVSTPRAPVLDLLQMASNSLAVSVVRKPRFPTQADSGMRPVALDGQAPALDAQLVARLACAPSYLPDHCVDVVESWRARGCVAGDVAVEPLLEMPEGGERLRGVAKGAVAIIELGWGEGCRGVGDGRGEDESREGEDEEERQWSEWEAHGRNV